MLQYNTITEPTLELLNKLQRLPEFSKLRLVGGTSLALQIGHRQSVDIDLFGTIESDEFAVAQSINSVGKVIQLKKSTNINIYSIDNIKVDIVNYPYRWIDNQVVENRMRLAGLKDIAAMKLAAITGRGTKKDFIDLYFLFKKFSLSEMLSFYLQKYPDGSEFLVLKSLTYFADAENDISPKMFIHVKWNDIKNSINSQVEQYFNDN